MYVKGSNITQETKTTKSKNVTVTEPNELLLN